MATICFHLFLSFASASICSTDKLSRYGAREQFIWLVHCSSCEVRPGFDRPWLGVGLKRAKILARSSSSRRSAWPSHLSWRFLAKVAMGFMPARL